MVRLRLRQGPPQPAGKGDPGLERSLCDTDAIIVETWLLLARRFHHVAAERFWGGIRRSTVVVEPVMPPDYDAAWEIGVAFADQKFSIVDRTSFVVMQRLGL